MNIKKNLLKSVFIAAIAIFMVSCENDDDENWIQPSVTTGAYILNSGNMDRNNANLAYYNAETGNVTYDVFGNMNGKGLGDTGQDMLIYGSKMYITATGSNVIYVLNKEGVIIKEIYPKNSQNQPDQPRSLAASEGKLYVSLYNGYVARIDTVSLSIDAKVQVKTYPEQITITNKKLYVANSGQGTEKTVSVIDLANFEATPTSIEVIINPTNLVSDAQGNVYVISLGDYGSIPNTLQKIDTKTNAVTNLGTATKMALSNNKIYIIYTTYNADYTAESKLLWYDISTSQMHNESFVSLTNDAGSAIDLSKASSISIDPDTKSFYIGTAPSYTSNGDMYIFDSTGKFQKKFDTGGINVMGAYFVTK